MRSVLIAVAALALCACASTPRAEQITLGAAPLSALMGKTQPEVRALLGAPSGDEALYFNRLRWQDDQLIAAVFQGRILGAGRNICPSSHNVQLWSDHPYFGSWVFRDGRLATLTTFSSSEPHDPDAVITLLCVPNGHTASGAVVAAAALVMAAPFAAATLPAVPVAAALDDSGLRTRAVSNLRIGAPLPGGVEGYAAEYAEVLRPAQQEAEITRLQLTAGARIFLEIVVENGIVTEIIGPDLDRHCRIAADGAIACPRS